MSDGRQGIKSFRISKDLVGAGRFERPTPCAQGGIWSPPKMPTFKCLRFKEMRPASGDLEEAC